ncbi:hypothetical protein HYS03_02735 [Candidatus Woesebacteria bacterium]|nr:hypothetical protein [Candidatus Woesebacteria bacterium]QQG47244.1 MAG: hypothetical protein HY044_03910 [Candidatus Woesebacteria bacterium]
MKKFILPTETWLATSLIILISEFFYIIEVPVTKNSSKAVVPILIAVLFFLPAKFSTTQKKNSVKLGLVLGEIIFLLTIAIVP